MKKNRVGIVSFDFDGTLANYFEFRIKAGKKVFVEDMQILKELLCEIKELEELDYIYFSLNTNSNMIGILAFVLSTIFFDADCLLPGVQFIGGKTHQFVMNSQGIPELREVELNDEYSSNGKLGCLKVLTISHIVGKGEDVVLLLHVEDGVNNKPEELEGLKEFGTEINIINLPLKSTRSDMLKILKENNNTRKLKQTNKNLRFVV